MFVSVSKLLVGREGGGDQPMAFWGENGKRTKTGVNTKEHTTLNLKKFVKLSLKFHP
jgi:hypothetical protein